MKKSFRLFPSIIIALLGILLISGIFLINFTDHMPWPNKNQNSIPSFETYIKLNELTQELKSNKEHRNSLQGNDFKQRIQIEKNWLLREQLLFFNSKLIEPMALKSYLEISNHLLDLLNQNEKQYSTSDRILKLEERIATFKAFLEENNMPNNHANLMNFISLWRGNSYKLFKDNIQSIGPWKIILPQIENTIWEANVREELKEEVLENLYFLRESVSEIDQLIILSNTYVKYLKKLELHLDQINNVILVKKENILSLQEFKDSLKNSSLLALVSICLSIMLCGWIRKIINRKHSLSKQTLKIPMKQKIPVHFSKDPISHSSMKKKRPPGSKKKTSVYQGIST